MNFDCEKEFSQDDVAIVGMPIFAGRLPKSGRDRLAKLKGNNTKAIAIANYGNAQVKDALLELVTLLKENNFEGQVTIHDGARPWIKSELILSVSELAKEKGAAAPIIPCVDTLKVINPKENSIDKHLERATLGAIQTPQAFDFETLYQANLKAIENNFSSFFIGTIHTCVGAILGGNTSPLSSE